MFIINVLKSTYNLEIKVNGAFDMEGNFSFDQHISNLTDSRAIFLFASLHVVTAFNFEVCIP